MTKLESIRKKRRESNEKIVENLESWEPTSEELQIFIKASYEMAANPIGARNKLQGIFTEIMLTDEVIEISLEICKEASNLPIDEFKVHTKESMLLQDDLGEKMQEVLTRVMTEAFQNSLLSNLGGRKFS